MARVHWQSNDQKNLETKAKILEIVQFFCYKFTWLLLHITRKNYTWIPLYKVNVHGASGKIIGPGRNNVMCAMNIVS